MTGVAEEACFETKLIIGTQSMAIILRSSTASAGSHTGISLKICPVDIYHGDILHSVVPTVR